MAELPFESPISGTARPGPALALDDRSATTKLVVRSEIERFSVPFATSTRLDGVLVAGTRPGEWLVIGDAGACHRLVDGIDEGAALTSVIDHTHARALVRVAGADATRLLEKLCDLDWRDDMTPDGAAVAGIVARVVCDIVRADDDDGPAYLLVFDRSFGDYLFDTLLDAGLEFGVSPG